MCGFCLVFHSFAKLLVDSGVGKQRSNDEWQGWCLGGVWEAFMRVGGRLQMTKMCVFCWLFHSNGRRETDGEKGGKQLGSWASLCVAGV